MSAKEFSIIGKAMPLADAPEKMTGFGKYTDDLAVPGMLVGRILHSPHPHAVIRSIDTSEAEALPGVKAVATKRMPPFPTEFCRSGTIARPGAR